MLRVYSTYGLIVFGGVLLVLSPLFWIASWREPWHRHGLWLNGLWSRAFFGLMGVPARVRGREHLDRQQTYVYTPNHFSLLDIALVGYIPQPFVFISKRSLTRLPLFGWVIRTFHIPVDRNSTRSSYQALQESLRKIDEGKSMVMYPEGGIRTPEPPQLAHFKSGPFRVAIEKQVPVVPVTIPHNWFILPNDKKLLMRPRRPLLIFHEPIPTVGLTEADVPTLRDRVFGVIEQELAHYHGGGSAQNAASKTSENASPARENTDQGSYITLYRGVHTGHPGHFSALKGMVVPHGGNATFAQQNAGNYQSEFTSWTMHRGVANYHANKRGLGGVILEKTFKLAETVPSPNVFAELEVLVPGTVTGAKVISSMEPGTPTAY